MTAENEKLLKLIKGVRLTVLADHKVDLDEAKALLALANKYAPDNANMADFAALLTDILKDGIVDECGKSGFVHLCKLNALAYGGVIRNLIHEQYLISTENEYGMKLGLKLF